MHIEPGFTFDESDEVLQLAQNLDFRIRPTGRRNMNKYQLAFPLVTFHLFRNLTSPDLEKSKQQAKAAKATFERSKSIVVCETVEEDFMPEIKDCDVDMVFVLRKQFKRKKINKIDPGVLYKMEGIIKGYLFEENSLAEQFQNKGYID